MALDLAEQERIGELLATPGVRQSIELATAAVNSSTDTDLNPVLGFLPPEVSDLFVGGILDPSEFRHNYDRSWIGGVKYQCDFGSSPGLDGNLEPKTIPIGLLKAIYEQSIFGARPVGSWSPQEWWVNWMIALHYPEETGAMFPHTDVDRMEGPTFVYTAEGQATMELYDLAAYNAGKLVVVKAVELTPNCLMVTPGSKMGVKRPHAITNVTSERHAITATHGTRTSWPSR